MNKKYYVIFLAFLLGSNSCLFAAYYDPFIKCCVPSIKEQSYEFKKEIEKTKGCLKDIENIYGQAKKEHENEMKKPEEERSDQLLEEYSLDLDGYKEIHKNLKDVYFAEKEIYNRQFSDRWIDLPKKQEVEVKFENMYSTESMQKEINE